MTEAPAHSHHVHPNGALRVRVPGEHSRVTPFELFFDLVFVFAVTQLSHSLAGHLDVRGSTETLLMMLTVWWAWMYTAWATNWLDPDHLGVRLMLMGVMLGGLVMAAAIPQAFDGRGFAFAGAYVAIQVLRSSFVGIVMWSEMARRLNFIRITIWFAVSGVLWIAGAAVDHEARLIVWSCALGLEYLGPPTSFWLPILGRSQISDWDVEGAHLAERSGLFIIIALGESLLVTGATFAGLDWDRAVVIAMLASFFAAVAMWWIYFDLSAEAGTERIGHAEEPGRLARSAYTYMHLPMVAGIVLAAVGDERILAHPRGDAEFKTSLMILGGPAVFLAGHWLFKRSILGRWVAAHLVAIATLGAILAAYREVTPYILSALATAVLVALAAYGRWIHRNDPD